MNPRLESALSILLTIAALAIASSVVVNKLAPTSVPSASAALELSVEREQHWSEILELSQTTGLEDSSIVIVQFGDFECPFCRRFHATTRELQAEFGRVVVVGMAHYPLSQHRFSMQAAIASECAASFGAFDSMADLMFSKQDSLGLLSWSDLARRAGVLDLNAFGECLASQEPLTRIEASRSLGNKIGVRGTPTVIVNGWRFSTVPNIDQLRDAVERVRLRGSALPPVGSMSR